jgi:flavoprotein
MLELRPCKLCGKDKPNLACVPSDGSTHDGWIDVGCRGCGQGFKLCPGDVPVEGVGMETGWERHAREYEAAKQEVVRRWNVLNS